MLGSGLQRSRSFLLSPQLPRGSLKRSKVQLTSNHYCPLRFSSSADSSKLRVLFLGSDNFSNVILNALCKYQRDEPDSNVESIHVGYRPARPSGRGLKTLVPPPIEILSKDLQLPATQIPTFAGWTPSFPIDLIVAASFRLKIPPRILALSRYGGWNLHPSLLPELPGAAPLHWTLLLGKKRTGVTLQTVHPEFFDQGAVVLQTGEKFPYSRDAPFLELREENPLDVKQLEASLASHGAKMLIQALKDERQLEQYRLHDRQVNVDQFVASQPTKEDRKVQWASWTSKGLAVRSRVLGSVWEERFGGKSKRMRRCMWTGIEVDEVKNEDDPQISPGVLFVRDGEEGATHVRTVCSGSPGSVILRSLQLDGDRVVPARQALDKAGIEYNHVEAQR